MVYITAHGGGCCGMKHIYDFRYEQDVNIQELIRRLRENDVADDRLQQEVILSNRQTEEQPRLVDELARLGFVYSSSWSGQHGTPVHLFLRAKRRLALVEARFYNRWVRNGGMVASPHLGGNLPAFNEPQNRNGDNAGRYGGFGVGDMVRVVSSLSRHNGQEALIRRFEHNYENDTYAAVLETGARITLAHLILVNPDEPQENREPTVYRHPNHVPQDVVEAPRRLILSQFYCVFQQSGLASRVFATLNEGVEAYPRARNWNERRVYSDGTVEEGPVNHG